jgi:hypothetical protein
MKKLLLFLLFTNIYLASFSQQFQWVYTKTPVSDQMNSAWGSVTTRNDGNLVYAGLDRSTLGMYGNIFFQKINPDGELMEEMIMTGEVRAPE